MGLERATLLMLSGSECIACESSLFKMSLLFLHEGGTRGTGSAFDLWVPGATCVICELSLAESCCGGTEAPSVLRCGGLQDKLQNQRKMKQINEYKHTLFIFLPLILQNMK